METGNDQHSAEVRKGDRFRFGRNWAAFLRNIDEPIIADAKRSLVEMLELDDLGGKSFVDAGSGSGLFSLAARQLGARVHSFDFDPQSVECTRELKRRHCPNDNQWIIEPGSLLDDSFLERLGRFDIVYSWGVVHHTGQMWRALEKIAELMAAEGLLFVAIYNDQGRASSRWARIKRLYNQLPRPLRFLILWPALLRLWGPTTLRDLVGLRPFETWRNYSRQNRGMSPWRDVVDWVGGYPFEVAKPEDVFESCRRLGMQLKRLRTCGGGRGCNEFVFRKS